jgi:predicted TPR repeat methyltransferase
MMAPAADAGSPPSHVAVGAGACRFCGTPLRHPLVDLGMSPLCESYLSAEQLDRMEPFYPLRAYVCERCFLVQVPEYVSPAAMFDEYAYFSAYSESWLAHARAYAETIVERLGLGPASFVVELGSNDGYLLQYFVARGIPVLGIDPARNVAAAARARGVPTLTALFDAATGRALASEGRRADLVVGNNVLAQVSDLNGFVAGVAGVLAPGGVVTMEFPHLERLLDGVQFDTIYHEHFSYFSLVVVERVFAAQGLTVFDVEELPTHGGSLRIYASHAADAARVVTERVTRLREHERAAGLEDLARYASFGARVEEVKHALLEFLIECRRRGRTVAGYGAPGKGNTLLNYCGIRSDLLAYTVDRNPYKQGKFLPGTHIPIFPPDRISETRPDYLLVLPWNLRDEIMAQMAAIRTWGGRFVVPIPRVEVLP